MFSRIAAAYALLDGVRRLLVNLLFLLTLVTLAVVFWVASEAPNLPKGTLLRIDLVGEVKESGPAEPSFMLSMFGQDSFEENTRLADVVDALDRAAHDDRIAGVVLRVDDLAGAGMAPFVKSEPRLTAIVRRAGIRSGHGVFRTRNRSIWSRRMPITSAFIRWGMPSSRGFPPRRSTGDRF